MTNINEKTLIIDVIKTNYSAIRVLESFGLYCADCEQAKNETLELASKIHNVDIEELLDALNNC